MGKYKINFTTNQKPHKEFCEIEGCNAEPETLHWHHIVERTDPDTSNSPYNIAILCSNCHNLAHAGRLEIIGVYPAANKYGRKLIYKLDGVPNIPGIEKPYFTYKPPQISLPEEDNAETK